MSCYIWLPPSKYYIHLAVYSHYEIQSEGPVQEISYVKDGDSAVLRLVKEEDLARSKNSYYISMV